MTFTTESAVQQATNLLHLYNGLKVFSIDEVQITLIGNILVNRTAKGYRPLKEYKIKIVIPLGSDELPRVLDEGNQIDKNYPHRYPDGELCLETDTNIRFRFIDGFSLDAWMSEYVETYFFSYEFYQRYGEFPFGERAHGLVGILQTYGEIFHEIDYQKVFKIMESISTRKYRGHSMCPCGSSLKIRYCHGPLIMKYYVNDRLNSIVQKDFYRITEGILKAYEKQ